MRSPLFAVAMVLLFAVCLGLYGFKNRFPIFYHVDEPGKGRQIVEGTRNFHHPLLMLTLADLALRAAPVERTPRNAVFAGRWCSAVFAALAVTAFTALGYYRRGLQGAICVAIVVGFHHQIFELAHYMKEDPALLMGFAFWLVALNVFWERRSSLSAAAVGVAAALAASGKYVGIVGLIVALPLVLAAPRSGPRDRRLFRFAWLAGGFLIAMALINYQLWTNIGAFREGLGREVEIITEGREGVAKRLTVGAAFSNFSVLFSETSFPIWFFAACHVVGLIARGGNPVDWITAAFPFGYGLMIALGNKDADRYFLPAVAVLNFVAALGIVDTARYLATRPRPWRWTRHAVLLLLVVACGYEWWRMSLYIRAFSSDSRAELVDWMAANLPANATVAEEKRVDLADLKSTDPEGIGARIRQQLLTDSYVPDLGSIEELRARGVDYAVVAPWTYGRYVRVKKLSGDEGEKFVRRREFYLRLLQDGELLWSRPATKVVTLHPALELYRLPDPADGEGRTHDDGH